MLAGSAERLPLDNAAVDAALVAQAWHWVNPDQAVPEIARVLRHGGRLGLVWNIRDERLDVTEHDMHSDNLSVEAHLNPSNVSAPSGQPT